MEKTAVGDVSEFEAQAQKTFLLATEICENKIKEYNCKIIPELKVLSSTVMCLKAAIDAFVAAESLNK